MTLFPLFYWVPAFFAESPPCTSTAQANAGGKGDKTIGLERH